MIWLMVGGLTEVHQVVRFELVMRVYEVKDWNSSNTECHCSRYGRFSQTGYGIQNPGSRMLLWLTAIAFRPTSNFF